MEQKTEASQAVDERKLFEQWAGDSRYKFVALQKMSGDRYVHPGVQADWEVWQAARAVLKAQPAPTEAPRNPVAWMHDGLGRFEAVSTEVKALWQKVRPRHVEHYTIPLYRHHAPTEAAQGEPCTLCSGAGGEYGDSKYWHSCPYCDGRGKEPIEVTQGEDSARLDIMIDWYLKEGPRAYFNPNGHITFTTKEMVIAKLDEAIAGASAETGGVKP